MGKESFRLAHQNFNKEEQTKKLLERYLLALNCLHPLDK